MTVAARVRAIILIAAGVVGSFAAAGGSAAAQGPAPAATPPLSLAGQEEFLRTARVIRSRTVRTGINGTLRATLSDGRVTHDASIQTVDEYRPRFESQRGVELDFRDSWRYNVAAYRLDQLLGLGMTPPSVERTFRGKVGAFTWWVDDVQMDEAARMKEKVAPPDLQRWNEQMWHVRLFDQLIHNVDRNMGNLLIDDSWRIWMIDHTRAFRLSEKPRSMESIASCDRSVLERLKALNKSELASVMRNYLTVFEVEALLARRDVIVRHLESTGAVFDWDRPGR
jgi:hypothetical protein